jgi:hypothetical protein
VIRYFFCRYVNSTWSIWVGGFGRWF